MQVGLLVFLVFLIIAFEAPNLLRNKLWRELVVFSLLLVVAGGLMYLYITGFDFFSFD
ncbi:MAG: hypothetical protein ACQEP9_02105 [Bacillota bacterium]